MFWISYLVVNKSDSFDCILLLLFVLLPNRPTSETQIAFNRALCSGAQLTPAKQALLLCCAPLSTPGTKSTIDLVFSNLLLNIGINYLRFYETDL